MPLLRTGKPGEGDCVNCAIVISFASTSDVISSIRGAQNLLNMEGSRTVFRTLWTACSSTRWSRADSTRSLDFHREFLHVGVTWAMLTFAALTNRTAACLRGDRPLQMLADLWTWLLHEWLLQVFIDKSDYYQRNETIFTPWFVPTLRESERSHITWQISMGIGYERWHSFFKNSPFEAAECRPCT